MAINGCVRADFNQKNRIADERPCVMTICYPCSLFQIYVTLKEITEEKNFLDAKINP
jgi:hypothetical protein